MADLYASDIHCSLWTSAEGNRLLDHGPHGPVVGNQHRHRLRHPRRRGCDFRPDQGPAPKAQDARRGCGNLSGFEALDGLLAAGVPPDRLHVHLGHTSETGGRKNPFARYHPMLHSKVYYMELPGGNACAFIGSHNVTAFALTGLNGEAAVLLEGPTASPEFDKVRQHIDTARSQSVVYTPAMKEAFAWWTREFIDGMKAEMKIPQDWSTVRTILLFASAARGEPSQDGRPPLLRDSRWHRADRVSQDGDPSLPV